MRPAAAAASETASYCLALAFALAFALPFAFGSFASASSPPPGSLSSLGRFLFSLIKSLKRISAERIFTHLRQAIPFKQKQLREWSWQHWHSSPKDGSRASSFAACNSCLSLDQNMITRFQNTHVAIGKLSAEGLCQRLLLDGQGMTALSELVEGSFQSVQQGLHFAHKPLPNKAG